MKRVQAILEQSGIFDNQFDESMRIHEVFIQPAFMKPYARMFGDFTILDGRFCVSMYDLVLIIFSKFDSVFKTTTTGIVLSPAERSDVVVRGAQRLSLTTQHCVNDRSSIGIF